MPTIARIYHFLGIICAISRHWLIDSPKISTIIESPKILFLEPVVRMVITVKIY